MFDSDMNWKSHIEKTCSKLAYGCHTLLKARECFGGSILRILYFAFLHSRLSYCIASWGSTYKTHLKCISRLQKRAVRIITYSNKTDTAKQLFQMMRVLPLDSVHVSSVADIVHGIIKRDDPFPLSNFMLPARCTRAAANHCLIYQ
uniref:Putative tick transposon n=1 Tax=Rhipicephalus microplus TaxID=6941 RepID=A0A6G5ACJ9_RHIMP